MALGRVYENALTPTTLGVQQSVVTDQTNGLYGLLANLKNLAAAETVEFQAFGKANEAGTIELLKTVSYTGVQTEPIKNVFGDAIPSAYYFEVRIKQTGGTLRSYGLFVWKIG